MFSEFENQVWTGSDASVAITNNTDTSIDGSCKSVIWTDAENETLTISFDEVDLSSYEEISLHIFLSDLLESDDLFTLSVGGSDLTFARSDFYKNKWNHVLIDCSGMSSIDEIVITSLVSDLTLFIDYLGYRKVTFNCDIDIITALKSHINIDYDVSTTLSSNAPSGSESISLTSTAYINDNTVLEIDSGSGTIETVELVSKDGTLLEALTNSFVSGNEVRAICPIRGDDYDNLEPDPICGIKVYDLNVEKEQSVMKAKNGSKIKEYLGSLGILIYIDCSSKKKLFQLSREFNRKYGKEFQFLLDGEQVDIYLDSSIFSDDVIGNNPRIAYYYLIDPQPYCLYNVIPITDLTVEVESVGV